MKPYEKTALSFFVIWTILGIYFMVEMRHFIWLPILVTLGGYAAIGNHVSKGEGK